MITAYIGLGSNLAQPIEQLHNAVNALANLPASQLLAVSSFYRSPALPLPSGEPLSQPDFINAVAALQTTQDARNLLQSLQSIEQQQGRRRERRWGPRTLDLDLLLYGDCQIAQDDLIVPHLELPNRAFVLYPLQEIAPELDIPGLGTLTSVIEKLVENQGPQCHAGGLEKCDKA